MFNPKDLYKILFENQKYIENETQKAMDKALKEVEPTLICPYHSIPFIDKKTPTGDLRMGSMASMYPDCSICNPNGKTNIQQTQNTTESTKPQQEEKQAETAKPQPEAKQAQATKPNVTPKPRTTTRIIRGNNSNNAVTGLSPTPKPKSVFEKLDNLIQYEINLIKYGVDKAIDFSWQQSKNVVGDALNSITGGIISSVGD